MKAGSGLKTDDEGEEETVRTAAAKGISVDSAVVAVLSVLDGIFRSKEGKKEHC